jgi:hypothetical protein
VTVADLAATEEIRRRLRQKGEGKIRTQTRYMEFCKLNRLEVWSTNSITLFLGSVKAQLSAGSFKQHTMHMKVLERERFQTGANIMLKGILVLAEEDGARTGVEHVDDFPAFEQGVLTVLNIDDPLLRAAATAMLALGMRFETITKPFHGKNIVFDIEARGGPRISYDLTFAKNKRTTAERTRVNLMPCNLARCPLVLLRLLRGAFEQHDTPFDALDYDDLNTAIKAACVVPEMTVTPGSLRRLFILEEIANNTVEGVTAWDAVARVTGHKRIDTLKAYYQRTLPTK